MKWLSCIFIQIFFLNFVEAQDFFTLKNNLNGDSTEKNLFIPNRIKTSSENTSISKGLNPIKIGSTNNALSQIKKNITRLSINPELGTILFVHPGNPLIAGQNASMGVYDISFNKGNNWLTNKGPLVIDSPQNSQVRDIQSFVFNPINNSNPDSAKIFGVAPKTPSLNSNWAGLITGSSSLDGSNKKKIYSDFGNPINLLSLTKRTANEYWAIEDTSSDGFIKLHKGTYDPINDTLIWESPFTLGKPSDIFDTTFDGTTHYLDFSIAFNYSGTIGWVAVSGELKAPAGMPIDTAYNPIFWKSEDAGNTWSGPIKVNLDSIPFYPVEPFAEGVKMSMGFDTDLAVDFAGIPHFFSVIAPCGNSPYSINGKSPLPMYDVQFYFNDWVATIVDTVSSFRGSSFGSLLHDNECAISIVDEGVCWIYSWTDTKPENQTPGDPMPNDFPDLFVNIDYRQSANLTSGSLYDGKAFLPQRSNECFLRKGPGSDRHAFFPIVFISPSGNENQKIDFIYLDDIEIECYIGGVSNNQNNLFNVSNNYPNPFSGTTSFDMNLNSESKVVVSITNLLGQVVSEVVNTTFASGAHTVAIDANGLNVGIYFYTVSAGGFDVTNKMIVK